MKEKKYENKHLEGFSLPFILGFISFQETQERRGNLTKYQM